MKFFKHSVLVALCILTVCLIAGCRNSTKIQLGNDEAYFRFNRYQEQRDWDACWALIDSCEQSGVWPPEQIHYMRGNVYYGRGDYGPYEQELREGIEAGKKELGSCSYFIACYMYMAEVLSEKSDFEGAMNTAAEALSYIETWDKEGMETYMDPSVILSLKLTIAKTYSRMGNLDGARNTVEELWEMQQQLMEDLPIQDYYYFFSGISEGILDTFFQAESYEDIFKWFGPYDEVFARCSQYMDELGRNSYVPKRLFYEIVALANTGQQQQAEELYKRFSELPETADSGYLSHHVRILRILGRYKEAARYYEKFLDVLKDDLPYITSDAAIHAYTVGYTLFRKTGNDELAFAMGDSLCAHAEPALAEVRQGNAAELATLYDTKGKETQIALQKARLSQQRLIGTGIALVLLTAFFLIYSWYRRRAQNRLAKAHAQLQQAYGQLEETTAAKERIESELRIARDIQMSMVPGVFPEREGLDMYAEMAPAKEVGGDLYGYVLIGDNLYFCVGDVSGKGVPASLFMAQSARLFRTLAAEDMMPADIAVRMNNALSENNDQGMFVTMFIGLLHLGSGRLDYCNCGHNPPVIDGKFMEMQYVNQPLGLWEGDPFEGETLEDIRGCQLLIYTDGLNEAEDGSKQQFGNQRLLDLMAASASLDSHQVIEKLKASVEQHRAGAEPNDDLTLMCIKIAR